MEARLVLLFLQTHLHLHPSMRPVTEAWKEQGCFLPEEEGPSPEPPGSHTQLLRRQETVDPAQGSSVPPHLSFQPSFPLPVSPGLPQ